MGKVRRVHALTNTASGVAGEARVAAELARCGIQVAKPYWDDDEVDLLVLWRSGRVLYPVPVQVKAIQHLDDKGRNDFIQNLKKRYVERLPSLCLAIYEPKSDRIWFIDTAERIRKVYKDQASWHKHRPYEELAENEDVRIGLSLVDEESRLDKDWLVPRDNASWLSTRIVRAIKPIRDAKTLEALFQHMFEEHENSDIDESVEAAVEPEEESGGGSSTSGDTVGEGPDEL